MDRAGRIRALVGGRDFYKRQFNVVTQGRRQPGSAFKPFIYASALANGTLQTNDYISNARFIGPRDPTTGRYWTPKNSQGRYGGDVSIRTALQWSYNMPVIRVLEKAGPTSVASMCRDIFGFNSEIKPFLSSALGASEVSPLEMLQGYSVFQLKGDRATPYIITRVIAPDGTVLKEYAPNVRRVLNGDVAEFIDECLRAVVAGGTGSRANSVHDARGKTGTTSDNKDAWFCGYTNEFVGVGWVANEVVKENGDSVWLDMGSTVYGGKVTIQIWTEVMKKAEEMVRREKLGGVYDPEMDRRRNEMLDDENIEPAPNLEPDQRDEGQESPIEMTPANEGDEHGPTTVGPGRTEPGADGAAGGIERPPGDDTTGGATGVSENPPFARPPDTPRPRPRPEPPPEPATDSVEICADSGLKANMYCPETVIRQYRRGSAPKRTCRVHKA
jgi:penicillin-binding protein 1A